MPFYKYRSVTAAGVIRTGVVEEASNGAAVATLRRSGLAPIEVTETREGESAPRAGRWSGASRRTMIGAVSELAVLLGAGLTLDRALAVVEETIVRPKDRKIFTGLRKRVTEGAPLSRAMAESHGFFPPLASAMVEAGEFDSRLDLALARLGETLEREESLRRTIGAALIYPALLLVIATAVVLTMLLWVVPQFEGLFDSATTRLPLATRTVMAISHFTRSYGLEALLALIAAALAANLWRRKPAVRAALDRSILRWPAIGPIVHKSEISRFCRTMASLVDGDVPLPEAVQIARGILTNTHLAGKAGRVATTLRQGGGLTAALAREEMFPLGSLGLVRTGEETANLGPMLARLADVLDRDVRLGVDRLIAVLTPLITVVLGGIVAAIIASIMTAILGFNDLAITQ